MKVVFLQDAPSARTGEVKDVKNGYARNFLLPRGIALPATKEAVERAQARARAEERRQAALDAEAKKLLDKVAGAVITLRARVGETGRLYGSITAADIADELGTMTGTEFDRRTIELGEPIRQVGEHTVHVRLTRNVATDITVNVQPIEEEE
ncbi:MAG TPA: 50S ribosomal protein L9 [Dehalococcoidia bacterium]|jgi:large subunit ribosomal protein L9|nr:50S ribosomal protein L9 [Dehalococcoidia bacterium]